MSRKFKISMNNYFQIKFYSIQRTTIKTKLLNHPLLFFHEKFIIFKNIIDQRTMKVIKY